MKRLSISQKALVVILYLLIVLMVFFSFQALKNLGNEGYQNCIQEKCETQGEQYCTKFREVNNCCLGAGGQIAFSDGRYICTFKS